MANDNNLRKTVDMIVALGAVGAAALVGASHIMEKFSKKEKQKNNAPLLLESPQAKEYVRTFTQTFFLGDFIGSKRIRDAVKAYIKIGKYDGAIREACLAFFEIIREKSGIKKMDAKPLIETAFEGAKPKLTFTNIAPPHVLQMKESTISFFYSIVKMYRNPIMHARLQLSEVDAIRQIALISYATEIVENNTERVKLN